eukprot:gene22865-58145_t
MSRAAVVMRQAGLFGKVLICEKEGIPAAEQRLRFGDHQLDDARTLDECGAAGAPAPAPSPSADAGSSAGDGGDGGRPVEGGMSRSVGGGVRGDDARAAEVRIAPWDGEVHTREEFIEWHRASKWGGGQGVVEWSRAPA